MMSQKHARVDVFRRLYTEVANCKSIENMDVRLWATIPGTAKILTV